MNPKERKQQILGAAKKLFARRGFFDTQISDIIKEANIARGTFYQYFESKEDIFKQLMEIFLDDFKEIIFKDVSSNAALSYRQAFTEKIRFAFQHFASDREMCSIVFRKAVGLPVGLDMGIRRLEKLGRDLARSQLQNAMDNGVLMENLDLDIAANMVAGAFSRTAYDLFSVEEPESYKESLDHLSENFVNTFIDGLAAPGTSSRK